MRFDRAPTPVVGKILVDGHSNLSCDMGQHGLRDIMLALRKPPFNLEVLEQQGKAQPGCPRFIRQQLELSREQCPVLDQFVGFPVRRYHDDH
jgi:hypothetical protein